MRGKIIVKIVKKTRVCQEIRKLLLEMEELCNEQNLNQKSVTNRNKSKHLSSQVD